MKVFSLKTLVAELCLHGCPPWSSEGWERLAADRTGGLQRAGGGGGWAAWLCCLFTQRRRRIWRRLSFSLCVLPWCSHPLAEELLTSALGLPVEEFAASLMVCEAAMAGNCGSAAC